MQVSLFTALILIVLTAFAFLVGRRRAVAVSEGKPVRLHSLPNYYGYYIALWTGAPAFLLLALYGMFGSDLVNSFALTEAQRAAEPMQSRYEEVVETDSLLEGLRAERAALAGRIEQAREAAGEGAGELPATDTLPAQSPSARVSALTAERRALDSRIDTREQELAREVASQGGGPLAQAGFEYTQLGPERRQLLNQPTEIPRNNTAWRPLI